MPRRKRTTAMKVVELQPGARVYAYLRDSGHANQERSIDEQRSAIARYAAERGLIIFGWFVDAATQSSDYAGRRQFALMLEACRVTPAPVAGVIVFTFSRFGRDEYDSQFYRLELRRNGIQVVSVTEHVPIGPMTAVIEAFYDSLSRAHLDTLSVTVREGFLRNIQAGCVPGGFPPVGYRAERVEIGRKRDGRPRIAPRWLIDEAKAPLVRRAFEMMAEGYTYARIEAEVGLLKRRSSYKSMFQNRTYLGMIKFGGQEFPGLEPLIDAELWAAVQARITTRAGHARKARRMGSLYLLSGLAHCALCDGALWGDADARRGEAGRYYRCPTQGCALGRVAAGPVEAQARNEVLDRVLTPEGMTRLLARVREALGEPSFAADLEDTRRAIGPLTRRVNNLIGAVEEGAGPKTRAQLAELETQLEALERRERALESRQRMAGVEFSAADLARVVQAMRDEVEDEDVEVARVALARFVERVIVSADGRAEVKFRDVDHGAGNSGVPQAGFVLFPATFPNPLAFLTRI